MRVLLSQRTCRRMSEELVNKHKHEINKRLMIRVKPHLICAIVAYHPAQAVRHLRDCFHVGRYCEVDVGLIPGNPVYS